MPAKSLPAGRFECRDLSMPFSADSEEAVELQAKPYGGCREGDAHDKPKEHQQKFVARGARDHAVVPFCPAAQHCDSRLLAHCHGAGSKFGTPCSVPAQMLAIDEIAMSQRPPSDEHRA